MSGLVRIGDRVVNLGLARWAEWCEGLGAEETEDGRPWPARLRIVWPDGATDTWYHGDEGRAAWAAIRGLAAAPRGGGRASRDVASRLRQLAAGVDGGELSLAEMRGMADALDDDAAPVARPPAAVDQLGPAVLAAIAELRAAADDAAPSRYADRIGAVADRLVRAACVLADAAGEPAEAGR